MWDAATDLAAALERLLSGIAGALAGAAPGWLALGVALHLANQVARGCGWHVIVRTATAGDPDLRRRDSVGAWVAGAGAGGVVSARGGDAVRVVLLGRRVPRAGAPCLAGTLVAEGAGDLTVGAAIVAIALALGVGPQVGAPGQGALWLVAAIPVALVLYRTGRRVACVRRVAAGVATGCAPLREPRTYVRRVLPWQLVSRACRAGAIACFLAAFGLPVTPAVVVLVMLAQGGARLVPFAPASVGAGAAMLAATFEPVTGTAVPAGQVAAFFVGTSTALTVVGTGLALAICLRAARWQALAEGVRRARRGGQVASANAGRNVGVGVEAGRPGLERTASIPTP
jgi:uncharacterized membrane protein YbhN (UPF0104 family)